MREFLRALDDPQERYPSIHIAGTSGKGSTATMIAAALSASGKRTGLHVKPHLRCVTERARIDGSAIAEEAFADILAAMMPAVEKIAPEHGHPSYYELLLALALVYFARERVDVAVVEAGLGGRLDGTNVLVPRVCVITSVGLDHTEFLGDTLVKIAVDKAGIAKPGVPLLTGAEDPAACAAIAQRCAEVGAPFAHVADCARVIASEDDESSFAVETRYGTYDLHWPLLGRFQQRNAATAIAALERLDADLRPSVAVVERAWADLRLPGRMEYVPGDPGIVFDIAHNPDKMKALAGGLRERFHDRRFLFVVAVAEGKELAGVLSPLVKLGGSFIFTAFRTPWRSSVDPQRLADIAREEGAPSRVIPDPLEALLAAREQSVRELSEDSLLVVTGSTWAVADARAWWLEHAADRSYS
jgi:dihydrofolate synthase/folylpolyglutamate synthase